ncbi:MAG: CDP-glycerol glycerophosphotransferase family protein, partial [Clostridiales Family XIII bacterium]|nr:CDP-glycerol glycerophosphotransferase family protein [Clostridiales Family XIII bacterium]
MGTFKNLILIRIAKPFLRALYFFMKLGPACNRAVFISRQGDEPSVDYEELAKALRAKGFETEMYLSRQEKDNARFMAEAAANLRAIMRQMKALAGARVAVTDGYSIPVSILKHRKTLTVIQVWHAIGAVKKFGLQTVPSMSEGERQRADMLNMHRGYDYFVAPSRATARFFAEAFGMDEGRALITGTPSLDALAKETLIKYVSPDSPMDLVHIAGKKRRDTGGITRLFSEDRRQIGGEGARHRFNQCFPKGEAGSADSARERAASYPGIAGNDAEGRPSKVVLYVPTYRKAARADARTGENTPEERGGAALRDALGADGYVVIERKHPIDEGEDAPSPECSAEELMRRADVVVTDYSSLAITAALLGKPLYFYIYDIEEYRGSPGLNIDPEEEYGKYAARDAAALARLIEANDYDYA